MKYFAIAPLAHLDLIKNEKAHMVITPFLKDPEVLKFYQDQRANGSLIMLDNGEFEAEAISYTKYLEYVEILDPDIIVLPDAWKDPEETIKKHKYILNSLGDMDESPTCMYVPHGENLLDYLQCLARMVNNLMTDFPDINALVGLTFAEWGDVSGIIRPFLSHNLMRFPGLFHFLGLYNTHELRICSESVVSVDTSMPFKAALRNDILTDNYVCTDRFDFHARLDGSQLRLAEINLKRMHDYVGEKKFNPFKMLR